VRFFGIILLLYLIEPDIFRIENIGISGRLNHGVNYMRWNARDKKENNDKNPAAGNRISHYEIIRKVGATGLGIIYQAEDTWKRNKVTLKLFYEDQKTDAQIKQFMIDGAEKALEIHHPNLLAVYEVGQVGKRDFIAMEYAEGMNLKQLRVSGRISNEGVIEIARQLCSAIKELHDNRMLAQNLIPEQIIVTHSKQVKFINFGMIDTSPSTGSIESLPADIVSFMSPEQINDRDIDERSNIFSLGVILYTLAADRPPFYGQTAKSVAQAVNSVTPQAPITFNAELPERLNRIIMKMLDKNPVHRYQTIDEIIGDLAYFKKTPEYETYAPKKKDSWNWVVIIAFIILLLISLWGYIKELIMKQ